MKPKLMAANWKMYKTRPEATATAKDFLRLTAQALPADRDVMVFPPFTALATVAEAFAGLKQFCVGAQNFHPVKEGAFTGEVSAAMIKEAGATAALAGHSERRHVFGESDELIGRKVAVGLEADLIMVLCIGETIAERRAGQVEEVLARQLAAGLSQADKAKALDKLAVAYEPVWAIGTGEVAGPREILDAHAFVRSRLTGFFGLDGAGVRILYGGSVKPDNAAEIIRLDNVDGVLVGGASLNGESFSRIALA